MIRGTLLRRVKGIPFFEAAEMPIAREVPLPAEIIETNAGPRISEITDWRDLFNIIKVMPVAISGKAHGRIAGQWYKVIFPKRLKNPHVVATAEARAGAFITSEIPRATKPRLREILRARPPSLITIPKEAREKIKEIRLDWPTIEEMRVEARTKLQSGCNDMMKKHIGDWLVPPFLSTETFCRALSRSAFGEWLSGFWDKHVKSKFEDLKGGINETVDLVHKQLWDQIDKAKDALQRMQGDYATQMTDQINKVRDNIGNTIGDVHTEIFTQTNYVRDRVNNVTKDLYRMWGVPSGYILTPVHIRNVTSTGFEFQSYGNTTIHYIAIGIEEEE